MNHKQKVKLARRMGGFLSEAWQERKDAIARRVERKNKLIKKAIDVKKAKAEKERLKKLQITTKEK